MKTVRFGIIGMGNIGRFHADYLLNGKIKGATLAREVLRAYFAEHGAKGVTPPN